VLDSKAVHDGGQAGVELGLQLRGLVGGELIEVGLGKGDKRGKEEGLAAITSKLFTFLGTFLAALLHPAFFKPPPPSLTHHPLPSSFQRTRHRATALM
jgi:hypothetical protein